MISAIRITLLFLTPSLCLMCATDCLGLMTSEHRINSINESINSPTGIDAEDFTIMEMENIEQNMEYGVISVKPNNTLPSKDDINSKTSHMNNDQYKLQFNSNINQQHTQNNINFNTQTPTKPTKLNNELLLPPIPKENYQYPDYDKIISEIEIVRKQFVLDKKDPNNSSNTKDIHTLKNSNQQSNNLNTSMLKITDQETLANTSQQINQPKQNLHLTIKKDKYSLFNKTDSHSSMPDYFIRGTNYDTIKIHAPKNTFIDSNYKERSLHEWNGKVTIINFWNTWNTDSISELKSLDILCRSNIDHDVNNVVILPIALDATTSNEVNEFYTRHNISCLEIFMDRGRNLLNATNTQFSPTTLIVDTHGVITVKVPRTVDWQNTSIQNYIKELLAK